MTEYVHIGGSASATETIERLLASAARARATDVHLDPSPRGVGVRMRIDGELDHVGTIPVALHEEIIARLKILAGARTDIHAIPQDGRFSAQAAEGAYNLRVSFMPTYHGENAVIRLLSASAGAQSTFAKLGFVPDHVAAIGRALSAPDGLILATGPTGSGKTTTLRVCLGLKAAEPLSVMTLEDPVEYEVPGVRHVHIRESFGVTFASGLRSALRQDPDVIMVGEIRDRDTARVAVNTALTGHLVLSTLHAPSAAKTAIRLLEMGVERYLAASTLRLVVSQRLVRAICSACSGYGVGCRTCRETGFFGRTVLSEALEVDEGIRQLIADGAEEADIVRSARERGFRTMEDDAAAKVEWGITTASEVAGALRA